MTDTDKPKFKWKTGPNAPPCACGKVSHARGLCRNCYDKHLKSVNPEFKRKQVESWKARYHSDPEFKDRVKAHARASEARTPNSHKRARELKRRFGIPVGAEDGLLLRQNGLCEICLQPPKEGRILVADHCHDSGEFRGLICKRCNTILGLMRDDVRAFERAANYLKRREA